MLASAFLRASPIVRPATCLGGGVRVRVRVRVKVTDTPILKFVFCMGLVLGGRALFHARICFLKSIADSAPGDLSGWGGVDTCTAALSATCVRCLFKHRPSGPKLVLVLGRSSARPKFYFDA